MGLIEIKKDLVNLSTQLNTIILDGKSLLIITTRCTDLTLNNLYYPCSKFINDENQIKSYCVHANNDIVTGLEILLKDLAKDIREFETLLNNASNDVKKAKENAKTIYELALLDVSLEGFLEYDMSIEKDINPYLETVKQVVKEGEQLKQKCIYWNSQLIVKKR